MRTTRSLAALLLATAATAATLSGPAGAAAADGAAAAAPAGPAAVGRAVPAAEQRFVAGLDHAAVARVARPAVLPAPAPAARPGTAAAGPDGPAVTVPARAPLGATSGPVTTTGTTAGTTTGTTTTSTTAGPATAAAVTTVTGVLWPGAPTANPNRQVGKLYFDVDPDPARTVWNTCSGTAVNSENRSTVVTAGHCVWDYQNRRWWTNLYFAPGYQYGALLDWYPVRFMWTTGTWKSSTAWSDDFAAVVVGRNSAGGLLVNAVGGHGIAFNTAVNQVRTSFGYPRTDARWPGFTADGEDLWYCQGVDSWYASGGYAGQQSLPCRMTGGASGGPWLAGVAASWLGTVTSVNSNKPLVSGGANYMFGPYLGAAESNVFQAARAAV